jgi:hypothetical protein
MSELENNSLEEVKTEPIIGKFKPKRKFLNFVSSVNGARVRFIRDVAFIDGGKLSGLLDNVIFKVTICDEGTINFEEQKGTNLTDDDMIKRLIADIDATDVTGYAQKFVVSGLRFTDIDGNPCFLEVEHEKPINVLASLFDQEEEKVEVSEKGLSILDMLFSDDDNDLVEENLELSEKDVEIILETVQNPPAPNEALKSANESYMEEQFRKMNERKIVELEDRVVEKHKDIAKYKSEVKQAEAKLKESTEQLEVLETRLETLKPTEEPNGYVFRVSEELKLETGLDESNREIVDRIADIMKLKKDVLFDYLTGGYYNIYFGDKNDFNKVELTIEILNKIKLIDPVGKFEPSEVDGRQVIQYRGKLNWHQLTDKMIRKGFEQNVEFDKLTGSNSYEQKEEEFTIVTDTTDVTDEDFNDVVEVSTNEVESKTKSEKSFITLNEYLTPTNLVVLGTSSHEDKEFKEALSINDGLATLDIRRGGKKMKAFTEIETAGSISVITLEEYVSFISSLDKDEVDFLSGVYEALFLPNFTGKLEIGIKGKDGWITDSSILKEEYIQNKPGIRQILLNIPEGQKVNLIEDHDITPLTCRVKSNVNKSVEGDYKTYETYDTPTNFVILGADYNGRDIEITDDYYSADLQLNGEPVKLSNWGSSFETEGHVSFMSLKTYQKWIKEFEAEGDMGVEAVLVTGFKGEIKVAAQLEDDTLSTNFDFGDYILHQVEDSQGVIINLVTNEDINIKLIEKHDLNNLISELRDARLDDILRND